jgi:hypothetical protein
MSWIDVDVIAKTQNIVGGVEDKRLRLFRTELENQNILARKFKVSSEKLLVKDVDNIDDMVTRILSGIGNRRIRRLRIFGHGSPGTIQMGPFEYTGQGWLALRLQGQIAPSDRKKVIHVTLTPDLRYNLYERNTLEKLRGHFESGGWVELQSCRIMEVLLGNVVGGVWDVVADGEKLIEGLSALWNVPVQASDARQLVGGGFEGNVWQARPGKKAEKIRVQPQSSGLNPASRTLLAGNNPLRDALDSLKPVSTAGACLTRETGQALVFTYDSTKVGSFAGQSQTSMTKKLVTQQAVSPSLKALHAQNNPIKAAIADLRGPSPAVVPLSKMPPGTTYSDINTRRTFQINALGKHVDTGMIKEFTPKHESSLASRTIRAHHNPLKDAFDSLKPRPSVGLHMSPGTLYSDITTGKSYVVNSMGRHVQTGSIRGFTPQPGFDRDLMAQRIRNDPLKAAFRKLGG